MKSRYFSFAVLIVSLAFCACSTINVTHVENNATLPEHGGIYYSLPKTAITVEVTINKIFKIKGPYSSYASKYLGLSNVITENSTSYSLEDIQVKPHAIPDADQSYFVQIPKRCKKSNGLFLKLSESGIISSINDFGNRRSLMTNDTSVKNKMDLTENSSKLLFKSNQLESIDTILEKIDLDTLTIRKRILNRLPIEKSIEQKAKDAADLIMQVKEGKFNILTGYSEVNYSKESLEFMCDQLGKMETEYLNMFTGITVKRQLKYYYTYIPAYTESTLYLPIFRFSAKEGIVDTSGYYGESVYMRIERFGSTKQTSTYEKAKVDAKAKSHGFYYRIPEYAKVSMICNDKVRTEANILISQFGAVCELPAGKKFRATFYPGSGSIKSIGINNKGSHRFRHH
jgi:hypothetical protein